jgi:ribosomal protein S18 acetylase RimI-like enzyme
VDLTVTDGNQPNACHPSIVNAQTNQGGEDPLLIRPAVQSDERPLARLDRRTWSFEVSPNPLWDEDVNFFATDPPEGVLAAIVEDTIAGYLKLRRSRDSHPSDLQVLEISGLAVDPGHQRHGIGRRLVHAAINEAEQRRAQRLTLHVLGTNTAARSLYRECGFEVVDVQRGRFRLQGQLVDDILMAR